MNLLLLNAASGSKLEQALEKLVDFGMDAGKDVTELMVHGLEE